MRWQTIIYIYTYTSLILLHCEANRSKVPVFLLPCVQQLQRRAHLWRAASYENESVTPAVRYHAESTPRRAAPHFTQELPP